MEDNKKPGARDISDLKARLGLKKTGTMAAVTPGTDAPAPTGATPQAAAPAAIPSPFGPPPQAAAPPAAPAAPPDPRRDPFAQQQAANLAAFYGYGQALPGSADSVEGGGTMEKKTQWGTIGAIGGGALLLFFIGSFWGGISKSRVDYNIGTDHAAAIRTEVEGLQKNLDLILAEFRKPNGGKIDLDQAKRLGELPLKKPDTNKIFHTDYNQLEGLGVERLFTYYNDTIKLYDEIALHAKRTAADHDAIQKFEESGGKVATKNYGVIMDFSKPTPLAHFAELGAPACPKAGQTDCKPEEVRIQYRVNADSSWSEKPIKGKPGDTVTPIDKSPLFQTIAAGSTDALAVEAYSRRLKVISDLIVDIEKTQKELMPDLKKTAERPKVFTF